MIQKLDGKLLASLIQKQLKNQVSALIKSTGAVPCLSVVLIGNDPASQVYVRKKAQMCEKTGIQAQVFHLPKDTSLDTVKQKIESLNQDPAVHGILVQLPLPFDQNQVLSFIDPKKDVDGLTPENTGRLWSGYPRVAPCTPYGIIQLLEHYKIPIEGRHVVIVGRSSIVGRPAAQLFLNKNATVTVCHSKTKPLEFYTKTADIVIAACGKCHLLNKSHFKKGAVVVDVGIHQVKKDGKTYLAGDVCPDHLEDHIAWLSPVPGGVGPMTIASLLENTVTLFKASRENLS